MNTNLKIRVGALVLGVTLAVAGSAFTTAQPVGVKLSSQWVYDPLLGSETDEDSYVPGTLGSCTPGDNICGIVAEEDPNNQGHPMFSSGQVARIQNQDTSQGDVYLKQ